MNVKNDDDYNNHWQLLHHPYPNFNGSKGANFLSLLSKFKTHGKTREIKFNIVPTCIYCTAKAITGCLPNLEDRFLWHFPDKYPLFPYISLQESSNGRNFRSTSQKTPNSNYQAKQRKNSTTASLRHLNPGTPLIFQPNIFHRIDYGKRMKKITQ